MITHLRAADIIDLETEAHYSFKTIHPSQDSQGRITTTVFHDHDFYEFSLITHGSIWHLVNHEEVFLATGALIFIRPADCHRFRQVDGEDCGLINLAFPANTVTDLLTYLGAGFHPERLLDPDLPPTVTLHEAERLAVTSQLTKLQSIPHTEKTRIRAALRLILAELLGRYFVEDRAARPTVSPAWLEDLCRQMKHPANLRGGVPRMQALAHTSPEHLSRVFRKQMGCTPTQYVNDLRLTYAANLLLHSDRPILDISLEIGLDNLSYFYRIFKERYHTSPAQFRADHRKRLIP
jgi:AraC family cel operon transcriptional repressor